MLAIRQQRTTDNGRRTRRRGVTLIEMLVTVAVLVIMMTILVQIFQAATGSVSAAQAYQQLDDQLRRLDGIIRGDLEGVTARFTPPLDPDHNLGYLEYGENEFADNQGEDGDDYIRFTAKAPPGKPFTGRFWVNYNYPNNTFYNGNANQPLPITITSDYAEIIYFVRSGNLYRRVLLIAPEMQSVIQQPINNQIGGNTYNPTVFAGSSVSWQGVNDLSARPTPTGNSTTTLLLNTLGDLTNRENRFAYPRFASDFWDAAAGGAGQDGIPDDLNQDNVPDLYPTLYPNLVYNSNLALGSNPALINSYPSTVQPAANLMAFPYVFPGAYSVAQALPNVGYQAGWIHAPAPSANVNGQLVSFDQGGLNYLDNLNHNPLDVGDNLPTPLNPPLTNASESQMLQTWWGFPTWRETLTGPFGSTFGWVDPTGPLFITGSQPAGLTYGSWNGTSYSGFMMIANGLAQLDPTSPNLLPPMTSTWTFNNSVSIPGFRNPDQPFSDGFGGGSAFLNLALWQQGWEDDLIMTGVRSFDVKAYDDTLANYADLGWGDDLRMYIPYSANPGNTNVNGAVYMHTISGPYQNSDILNNPPVPPPYLVFTPHNIVWPPINPQVNPNPPVPTLQTFAHEGRMPPLTSDNRLDAQYPNPSYISPTNFTPQYPNYPNYSSNIGDNSPNIVRLRRVWDTWSTDYSQAPGTGVNTAPGVGGGFPLGPPFTPPVYPSYPPPYPAPLRGLQIQIRVADPTNQRIKSLTIRQDFTDKL